MYLSNNNKVVSFTVAVLVGVHFLPYVWIYESKSYGLLSVGTVLVTSICGVFFVEKGFMAIPIAVTTVYVIIIVGLSIENKKVGNQRNDKMTA